MRALTPVIPMKSMRLLLFSLLIGLLFPSGEPHLAGHVTLFPESALREDRGTGQANKTNGDLHINNNVSERTLKLIGVGRLNWLFVGSDNGGRTAAVLFSFTATCKQLGIDSFA